MNRRNFMKWVAGAAGMLCVSFKLPTFRAEPSVMQHAYMNGDGEIIAANTLEQAARYYDCELAGADHPNLDDWMQLDDGGRWPMRDEDGGKIVTKTAKEWAAEHCEPGYISSTYC